MHSPSPSSSTEDTSKTTVKSQSIVESFRGCGISGGFRMAREELRQRLMMPQYLRLAMRDSIRYQDPTAGEIRYIHRMDNEDVFAPPTPMVVFINPRSGGRHGPVLMERLQHLISEEQVFDLSEVKPHEFIQYGLGCLEALADLGDSCASETRESIRIMVAGGDGTVGWVLGCLTELHIQRRVPVPPVGIIPLGTGNDLSRSFGWGGSFPYSWKAAIKRTLYRASIGPICRLDRYILSYNFAWNIMKSCPEVDADMDDNELQGLPYGMWLKALPQKISKVVKGFTPKDIKEISKKTKDNGVDEGRHKVVSERFRTL
ncbi:hypothetical protein VNO77_21800 [Canavalia gladiata]|uniref:DAGKc domain-containing protein n=1 Tax=Canavalia gladiata TaxID=3824 RepID=A0AAN9L402_CANGL